MKEFTFNNNYLKLSLPEGGFKRGQKILFMGFLRGVTGGYKKEEDGEFYFRPDDNNTNTSIFEGNMMFFLNIINSGAELYILSTKPTILHFWTVMKKDMYPFVKSKFPNYDMYLSYIKRHMKHDVISGKDKDVPRLEKLAKTMKFDYIIQNPPYNGSLHLDFFEKGFDLLTEKGKMVIIEPATWLINVRKNGRAKRYDAIKKRIEGHVESVKIENLNKDFGTTLRMPFAITTIDMSKTFDTIDLIVCGEHQTVKSIYDCNLIGDYATIWDILDKCLKFGDMMKAHTTDKKEADGNYYCKYLQKIGSDSLGCAATTDRVGMSYDKDTIWGETKNGFFAKGFVSVAYHHYKNEISETPLCFYDKGKHLTDKICTNLYGTKAELENWKYFIHNNKLPLFINIVVTDAQDNTCKDFLPWLINKQYTDDEINQMFGFTEEEIKLIDRTIKKYERNSPWFKRYMCGHDSVSDEEVNNFLKTLD